MSDGMELLTTEEAARRLGVSRFTARNMALDGRLPFVRITAGGKRGDLYAFPAAAVELARLEREMARGGGA